MYRVLAMFPPSADPQVVDDSVRAAAAAFARRPSFLRATTSVDAVMGPSARDGLAARLFEADFDDLDDVLAALGSEDFHEVRTSVESLAATLLLYECREV